jgi:hypothetical protein
VIGTLNRLAGRDRARHGADNAGNQRLLVGRRLADRKDQREPGRGKDSADKGQQQHD